MSYKEINVTHTRADQEAWKNLLKKPLPERDGYVRDEHTLSWSSLAARVLGTPHDPTDYFIELHELYEADGIHVLSETLNRHIEPEHFQALQRIHLINQEEKGLSVNRFVAFLDGEQLIVRHPNPAMNRHIRLSLIRVFEHFQAQHEGGFQHPDFRRVLLDVVKFSNNHLGQWLQEVNIEERMPAVIWYGEANKSQLYFLYYVMLIGCDVVFFHPEGKDPFCELDPEEKLTFIDQYPGTSKLEPFPTERPERKSTVAYRSTRELEEVLHTEDSMLYKPWQFRDHTPESITLKTTYDELFLIAKEPSFIRPNFKADRDSIQIPNLFAKMMGVTRDKREYWDRIHTLMEGKETKTIRHFPFTKEVSSNYQFHYQHALSPSGEIDPDLLMKSNVWQFSHLYEGTQRAIAEAISRICQHRKLLREGNETELDVRIYLFKQILHIGQDMMALIQTFDYAQTVPKVILYHTEYNGELTRSDAAALIFLNEIGVDLFVYHPAGYQCMERYIDDQLFDIHWLDDMVMNQEFKEPSIVRKLFQSIKNR
ncbi:YceG family protein [Bacillus sp. 179-C3.3 HS]|uniref:YceG family protein n=1 Tax=Bacillus sp. 179-C3.3 HS TaxID=3232162 RepID=UPI0039A3CB9B